MRPNPAHALAAALALHAVPALAQEAAPANASADAACATPGEFPDATLDAWKVRELSGETDYALVEEAGLRVLSASTDGAASILYREREVDLTETPILSWSWKVDAVYADIDERTKAGDDYPARLYVVAKTGLLPWQTLALNYVWASGEPVGASWPNPFTGKARMIAVRSGSGGAGAWSCERRDVAADFEAAFGRAVDEIAGYAVMADGDNGDRRGAARFGALGFAPR